MNGGRSLQDYEQAIPFTRDGLDRVAPCPVCRSGRVRLQQLDGGVYELSCNQCAPTRIREWERTHLNGGGNGKAPLAVSEPVWEEWDDPLPLADFSPPEFPLQILPQWLRQMVEAMALCLSVPVGAAAMFSFSCLAAACQKRVQVQIRAGWIEPLSLWVLIVMEPANRKSPLFRQLLAPVVAYQMELRQLMQPEIAASAAARRIMEGRLKRAEQEAIKAKDLFLQQDAEKKAADIAAKLEGLKVPAEPRLIVNDATPEKLGMLIHANGGRMAVMSPEGDVFQMMAGHYSSGQANLGLYLAGHSGDDWTVDRVSRESVDIVKTAITFGLTVQPDVLSGFASTPQFRGRGLLGRFLYCVPETLLGSRPAITPAVLEAIETEYAARLTRLLGLPAQVSEGQEPQPNLLEFDEDASRAMEEIQNWIEPQLGPWGSLRPMADWAGKLAGQMARIASLLHLAELSEVDEPWRFPVEGEFVASLFPLRDYLIAHARTAFRTMGADPATEGARHILKWLKSHPVGAFTRRNLHRRLIGTFETVTAMDPSLALLLEYGYLRQIAPDTGSKTGPKSICFRVHPLFAGDGGELSGE